MPGTMEYAYNLNAQKAETEGTLCEASLGYTAKPYLKNKTKTTIKRRKREK